MRLTLLVATLGLCGTASAQDWRTLEVARQVRDSQPINAKVTYGAGSFTLGPSQSPADLYEMKIHYGAGSTTPVATYDAHSHSLRLGITSKTFAIPGGDVDQNDLHVGLARGVPLNLTTEIGAADVKIDLGGLSVAQLALKTGASDATLAFSSPNEVPMQSMMLEVGAAGFKATGLANARASNITLKAGIGSWDLYFDGNWTGDITLDAKVGLGSLTIHVPDNVRVDQNAKAMLGDVTGDGDRHHDHDAVTVNVNDDDSDSADDSDDSDSATASAKATKAAALAAAKAARAAAVQARAQAAVARAQAAQARAAADANGPHFTLHIVGNATLGQISFDHKLGGGDGE